MAVADQQLGPPLETDVSKTAALEISQAPSIALTSW